jgi:DNA invertase Pin-like site-specific DNA recombinase
VQRAGAGIRSLAEPYLDTTFDFAEIIFAILGVAAKLERRRILERTAHGWDDAKANGVKFGRKPILTHTSKKRPASASKRRDAAQRRPQLQRQSEYDFETHSVMTILGFPERRSQWKERPSAIAPRSR